MKKRNIILIVLCVLAIGMSVLTYINNTKEVEEEPKEDNQVEEVKKIDEEKEYAYYEATDELGTISLVMPNELVNVDPYEKLDNNKWSLKNGYVVINLDTEDAKKINEKYKNDAYNVVMEQEDGQIEVDIKSEKTSTTRIYYYNSVIKESNDYISILRFNHGTSVYSSAYVIFNDVSIISKKDGKLIEPKTLIKENLDELLNEVKEETYTASLYDDGTSSLFPLETNKTAEDAYLEIKNKIENNEYAIYVNEKGEVQLTIYGLSANGFEYETGSINYLYKNNKLELKGVLKP